MKDIFATLKQALVETEATMFRLSEQRSALKNQIAAIEAVIAREPPEKKEGGDSAI